MFFKLTNETQSQRHVWAHGSQTLVAPGETKTLNLTDNNAVFLKRCEKRGDQFKIEALNEEGAEVLRRANVPMVKGNYPRGVGPDTMGWGKSSKSGEIRDGVEEARLIEETKLAEEARLKELAKQPDPGMRPTRVPREQVD